MSRSIATAKPFSLSARSALFLVEECGARTLTKIERNAYCLDGADTPARITGDSYKNGGEVNSCRRYSGMDVDPSGRENHSGPGRDDDHSQEPKRPS
ncbi:hypothetical protein ACET3Z_018360 [Daucus carota]